MKFGTRWWRLVNVPAVAGAGILRVALLVSNTSENVNFAILDFI